MRREWQSEGASKRAKWHGKRNAPQASPSYALLPYTVLICMLSVWPVFHSNQPHCIIQKYICAKHTHITRAHTTHTQPWSHKYTEDNAHFLCFVLLLANESHSTIERMPNYMLASQCAINLYLFVCAHLYYIIVYRYMRISLGYCKSFGAIAICVCVSE